MPRHAITSGSSAKDGLQWVPVDPVAAAQTGEAATQARETFDAVPESRQHVVTFTLNVEQRAGGTIETKPALTLRAPAADLHAQPILLAHQVDVTGSGAWKATPVLLVGDKAVGGTPYGPGGVQTADNSGAGGIGNRLNQMFGGDRQRSAEIAAVWLDVTMTSPDGRAETARREVFDRLALSPAGTAPSRRRRCGRSPGGQSPCRAYGRHGVRRHGGTPERRRRLAARVAAAAPILRDEALRARLAKGDAKGIPVDRLKRIGMASAPRLRAAAGGAPLVAAIRRGGRPGAGAVNPPSTRRARDWPSRQSAARQGGDPRWTAVWTRPAP